ncbi:cupredoxin domain-containing protein [Undibacterium sp. Di26W]|uniref:cupredoxin domain-containing protein n=1 Tax=Undibacterium sp. Di26W TaxID=3413035 RepID=UPI003BF431E3
MKLLHQWRFWLVLFLLMMVCGAVGWGAFATIQSSTRDELFAIPKGTWARRMAGDKVDILPAKVYLTLGVNDVLLLKNLDDVPQIFGPVLIMPGQSFRLPFALASDYQFECSAHASGQMSIIVAAMPEQGWARLRWRLQWYWNKFNAIILSRNLS